MPSAFELIVKWWLPALHPGYLAQAVSKQASAKEGGWSLLLLTPEGVCFAHSGDVFWPLCVGLQRSLHGLAVELRWT